MSAMPKLSVELLAGGGQMAFDLANGLGASACMQCGTAGELGEELAGWLEHDDADRPTAVAVVLCTPCADRIIEKHPRLYRRLDRHEPFPGVMPTCAGCVHQRHPARATSNCAHPDLKANGGAGLRMECPRPFSGFACGRGYGGPFVLFQGPVTCSGRAARASSEDAS